MQIYLWLLAGVYFLHLILKMNGWCTLFAILYLCAMLPIHKRLQQRAKHEKQRVQEVATYMDALLYAFLKEGKIDASIRDVWESLADGELRECVSAAMHHMNMTFDESEVMARGLAMVEAKYPSKMIRNLHQFMLHVEDYGGERKQAIALLTMEKNMWEKRMDEAMAKQRKMYREVLLSIASSLLICGLILYMPVNGIDISEKVLPQILTLVVIVLDDWILLRAQKYLAKDWVEEETKKKGKNYAESMQRWVNWNSHKEALQSFLWAILPAIATVLAILWHKKWGIAIGILATLFACNQHRIGHYLEGKKLRKEIRRAFPNWLMDMVLLLQSENVQMALQKSRYRVPDVLKEELEMLLAKLDMNPENAKPYHEFLGAFHIPEVHSAMGMLYSISAGYGGNQQQQLLDLMQRNQKMLDVEEVQRLEDASAGLYLLFLAPVLSASLKILVDMAVFMLSFLSANVI